jgi:hypothetical protein
MRKTEERERERERESNGSYFKRIDINFDKGHMFVFDGELVEDGLDRLARPAPLG